MAGAITGMRRYRWQSIVRVRGLVASRPTRSCNGSRPRQCMHPIVRTQALGEPLAIPIGRSCEERFPYPAATVPVQADARSRRPEIVAGPPTSEASGNRLPPSRCAGLAAALWEPLCPR